MSELSDVPLDKSGSAPSEGSPPEVESPALMPRLLIGLLVGVLVGVGYVVWRSQGPASPAPVLAEAPSSAQSAQVGSANTNDTGPTVPMPPLDESDAAVRELIGGASSHPAWKEWLTPPDLARRFTAAIVNLAAGESPTPHVRGLAPKGPFAVRRRGATLTIDPASYSRYDALADVIGSTDTAAVAGAFRSLRPLFEAAHRELGETGSIESLLTKVGGAILAVPVIDTPIEVQEQGALYAFVDPALEQRSKADKHFLRLGPRNLRIIQAKLKDVMTAAGLRAES